MYSHTSEAHHQLVFVVSMLLLKLSVVSQSPEVHLFYISSFVKLRGVPSIGLGWSLAKNNSPARKDQERGPGSSNLTMLISLKQQKNKYTLFSLCNREEILPPATSEKT